MAWMELICERCIITLCGDVEWTRLHGTVHTARETAFGHTQIDFRALRYRRHTCKHPHFSIP